jgi:hypothetical protein
LSNFHTCHNSEGHDGLLFLTPLGVLRYVQKHGDNPRYPTQEYQKLYVCENLGEALWAIIFTTGGASP